jgi:hypothetical protein
LIRLRLTSANGQRRDHRGDQDPHPEILTRLAQAATGRERAMINLRKGILPPRVARDRSRSSARFHPSRTRGSSMRNYWHALN